MGAQPHRERRPVGPLPSRRMVIETPDLAATEAALAAKGVAIVSPPREVPNGGGSRFAFIHDNEGMLVELFQPA